MWEEAFVTDLAGVCEHLPGGIDGIDRVPANPRILPCSLSVLDQGAA